VLNYSSDVSVRSWDYHLETAHVERCHLIARLDLPLGIDAYDAFVEYIRRAHNPRYVFVCKQTTTRDFVKHFNQTLTFYRCFLHQQITWWSRSRVPVLRWSREQLAHKDPSWFRPVTPHVSKPHDYVNHMFMRP
jgi:hypothetical protein